MCCSLEPNLIVDGVGLGLGEKIAYVRFFAEDYPVVDDAISDTVFRGAEGVLLSGLLNQGKRPAHATGM